MAASVKKHKRQSKKKMSLDLKNPTRIYASDSEYNMHIIHILNDISGLSKDDLKKEFDIYIDQNNMPKKYKKCNAVDVITLGKLAWMMNRDVNLNDKHLNMFSERLNQLDLSVKQDKSDIDDVPQDNEIKVKKIEPVVDYQLLTIFDKLLDTKQYRAKLKEHVPENTPLLSITDTLTVFKGYDAEMTRCLSDLELREYYNNLTQIRFNRKHNFIKEVIQFLESERQAFKSQVKERVIKQRKKRTLKPSDLTKKTALFKYMATFPDMNLTSEHPSKIFDSKCVVLYNTRHKIMSVLYGQLTVHRQSIIGFQDDVSFCKRVKCPESVIPLVLGCKKSSDVQTILSKIPEATRKVQHRSNEDTLILRVFK